MKKLTLMVMASLCLLIISCEQEEFQLEDAHQQLIEQRSANNISINYRTALGNILSVSCTHAEINYLSTSLIDLSEEYAYNTTADFVCQNVQLSAATGYVLDVLKDNNTSIESDDLAVVICDMDLCYSASDPTIAGSSLSFIVEDEPEGL